MPFEGWQKRWGVAALTIIGGLQAAAAWAAEPAKDVPTRRGYDFTRPEPGAILPNPTEGVGTPPQLREYVTVHAMTADPTQADGANAEMSTPPGGNSPPGRPPAGAGKTAAPRQGSPQPLQSAATTPQASAGSASPNSAAGMGAKPPSAADYAQKLLAEQVAARGIGGPFAYRPSGPAETDAALAADEQKAWNNSVARLASSWQAWQASHRALSEAGTAAAQGFAALPGRPGVETAPGRILLSGAPAGVTGDLPQSGP